MELILRACGLALHLQVGKEVEEEDQSGQESVELADVTSEADEVAISERSIIGFQLDRDSC